MTNASDDVTEVLQGPWDENRKDIVAVTQVFESDTFKKARRAMADGVAAGWQDQIDLEFMSGVLAEYRRWMRWLIAHSRWAREQKRDPAATVEDWIVVSQLHRQACRDRTMLLGLVTSSIAFAAAQEMMLTAKESPGFIDIKRLFRELDECYGPTLEANPWFMGQGFYMLNLIEHCFVREGGHWIDVSQLATYCDAVVNGPGAVSPRPSRLWNLASPLFHDYETACKEIDKRIVLWSRLPDVKACRSASAEDPESFTYLAGLLDGNALDFSSDHSGLSVDLRCLVQHYRSRTSIEAARTMLALGEYHRRNGRYPDQLADLVPEYLPRMPIDCGDRQPLRYRRTDGTYLLYGVDLNGLDDGGQSTSCDPERTDETNLDMVFSKIERRKEQR